MLQKFIQAAWELGEGPPSTRCPSVDLLEGDGDHALPWESGSRCLLSGKRALGTEPLGSLVLGADLICLTL